MTIKDRLDQEYRLLQVIERVRTQRGNPYIFSNAERKVVNTELARLEREMEIIWFTELVIEMSSRLTPAEIERVVGRLAGWIETC
ncbi:MAG TPA: hypothetical protein VFA54_14930 [Bryobacterales bacterium]|jgi:hypothetical protein|nr:hypothetical protein [Bryobacterales bacterium]